MILYFLRHASAGQHMANPKKDEKRALDKDGIEPVGDSPAEFKALIDREIAQWRELAKSTKITID